MLYHAKKSRHYLILLNCDINMYEIHYVKFKFPNIKIDSAPSSLSNQISITIHATLINSKYRNHLAKRNPKS